MAQLNFSAPLDWPRWVPVTPLVHRKNDRNFAPPMELKEAIDFLQEEIDGLGCPATLSLDIESPLSERLYKTVGKRVGVSLALDYMDGHYVIACDTWQQMEHNIYAIHLALRGWRNMERWGIAPLAILLEGCAVRKVQKQSAETTVNQSAKAKTENWMVELGLGPTATQDDLQAVYHRRAKKLASDTDALVKLNITMEVARAHFAKKS